MINLFWSIPQRFVHNAIAWPKLVFIFNDDDNKKKNTSNNNDNNKDIYKVLEIILLNTFPSFR